MKYLYLLLIIGFSAVAAFCYAADKLRAKHNRRRYSERLLLSLGIFGAPGALLAMNICHHKTKKRYFWIVNLVCLAAEIALGLYLFLHKAE
jgi:uncharacterized membrane protein YsdA (DUF1294 family)